MAQSQNTHVKDVYAGRVIFATDKTAVTKANQGDIVCFDVTLNSGNGGVRAVNPTNAQSDIDGTTGLFVGIAEQNSVVNSLNDPQSTIAVAFKNVFNLKTTAGEVYKHYQPVYWNSAADVQTVTNVNPGGAFLLGVVILPQEYLMNGTLSVTGAAGILIPVAIKGLITASQNSTLG